MNLPKGYYLQHKKYRLTNVIGQGGFGITYLGVWSTEIKGELGAVKTDVPICIKEYFFKDYCFRDKETWNVQVHSRTGQVLFDKFKEKMIKEAKILSEVHHPYIVNVLEVFEENNTAYIAMEHIPGCSLKYMLEKEGVLPEKKVLKYISQIGQALDFVHQKNILHLDIKPNNVLIDTHDNARLIDFGVSKRYDVEHQETSTTVLTLSKGFASIEQYDSEGIQTFSPCPDIYSLGATMYNLLTGEIPTESILRAAKPLVKPSELNKNISPKTEKVILKAMQVKPADRFQTIKQMLNELDIPPYFEETENLLEQTGLSPSEEQDENTEVNEVLLSQQMTDDGQTIVRSSNVVSQNIRKKKRKRRMLIPFLIFFFTFAGCAVAYIFDLNKSREAIQTNLVAGVESIPESGEENLPDDTAPPPNNLHTENNVSLLKSAGNEPVGKEKKTNKETETETVDEKQNVPELSDETINTNYNILIASGKKKLDQKNYAGAKEDFAKAQALKMTEEVFLLARTCEEKEEEQKITERKALYEEIMPFGNYMIVKKISTRRYGAIDAKGKECIKSIYLSVGRSNDGRAFEREDHRYDIYNAKGELLANGLESY
jgi:serine/threonine-protein kinase